MSRNCPLTGETARVTEGGGRVTVEHARLGPYVLEASALSPLEDDAGLRDRIVRWLAESPSFDLDVPILTLEHIHLFGRLADLEAAVSEWNQLRLEMKKADEERLWRKLQLEWNYNSNHIEGNTLTYHETELLLIHGRTAGGHPMRHYEEMKAHDIAIAHTRSLRARGADPRRGRYPGPEQDPPQGAFLAHRGDSGGPAVEAICRCMMDGIYSQSNEPRQE